MENQCPVLTCDNIQLSKPNQARMTAATSAWKRYAEAALSENTRRAYRSDLNHFFHWGGSVPASAEAIGRYLADHANRLSVATLSRRLIAIRKAHITAGFPDPCADERVKLIFRGIKRLHGRPQRKAAAATKADILAMASSMGCNLKDLRDTALILVGFAGAFRRSELVAIDCNALDWRPQGVVICLPRCKTDAEGRGREVAIPFGAPGCCPVQSLLAWLENSGITSGPVFRSVDRHGNIGNRALTGQSVAEIVKLRAISIGRDGSRFSGHSLRAGLATSAAAEGKPAWKIRQQTGHVSQVMLERYIRAGELFKDNAADILAR